LGDSATVFADPSLANKELGWKTERDINQMCEDVWRWQSQNPNGYGNGMNSCNNSSLNKYPIICLYGV
jgi:UDP-glucose 4-epimerase